MTSSIIEMRRLRPARAFSLIELLVVISVIGILAAVGIPALKGMGGSTASSAAIRQLLDDLAYARNKAINQRTTVYVVFASPQILNQPWNATERREIAKYANLQYTSYALFARRSLGDQPGAGTPRYITEWRTLPDGIFIPTNKFDARLANDLIFDPGKRQQVPLFNRPLMHELLPFPYATNRAIELPYIAFDYQGRLKQMDDIILPISRGSIVYPQDDKQKVQAGVLDAAEVIETPKGNSTNNTSIRIDWLTGRARPVRAEKVDYAAVQ